MKHVIVIGGGIIGLSSAYYLQQNGCKVTVIDKNDFTDNCSYGNAGYVCPSHFIPLASPGIVKQGLKWMLNSKSPFYVKPAFNRALINWGLKFIKSATAKNVVNAAVPLRDLALLSQKEYEQWAQMPAFDFAYQHKGLLEIFKTQAAAHHAHNIVEKAKELNLDAALLSYDELQQLEPHTKINALGAVFFKCDSHMYPNKLMKLLAAFLQQNGVTFIANEEVKDFEKANRQIKKVVTCKQAYDTDAVVLATGSWSRNLAKLADVNLPLVPGRGYSVTLENSPYKLNYPAILMERRVAITPMDGNKIRFGGTMEVVKTNTPPNYARVSGILASVKKFFPQFDVPMPAPQNIWYGFRPCSADGLPYIGKVKSYNNLVIATGHSMLGLSLGAATGKLVSELVNEQALSMSINAFAVERFG